MNGAPRVVEAGLRSFRCAYSKYLETPYELGQMVAVREGRDTILGVVAECESGPDDPARPLEPRGEPGQAAAEVIAGEPVLRLLLRTRMLVVTCGYLSGEWARATLPPSPPPLLSEVLPASDAEVVRIAGSGAVLARLPSSPECDGEVVAAAIRRAREAFPAGQQREFTVAAGKELARLLHADLSGLTTILRSLQS